MIDQVETVIREAAARPGEVELPDAPSGDLMDQILGRVERSRRLGRLRLLGGLAAASWALAGGVWAAGGWAGLQYFRGSESLPPATMANTSATTGANSGTTTGATAGATTAALTLTCSGAVSPLPPRTDRLAALVHTRDDRVLVVDGDGRCWSGPSGLDLSRWSTLSPDGRLIGGTIPTSDGRSRQLALRNVSTGLVRSYSVAPRGLNGLFIVSDPAGERWSADSTRLYVPASPGPVTDMRFQPSGVVLIADARDGSSSHPLTSPSRASADLAAVPAEDADHGRAIAVLGFAGGDLIGVAGAGTRDCGLQSLNLDNFFPRQGGAAHGGQRDVARVIDWQSTGATLAAAWCLGAEMVGSVAPDGRSVGLAASNGGGGIRWSVADLGTGAEGTVSLLPGSWVPGAPRLADQPLTKGAGSPGTGSTGTRSTGTRSTGTRSTGTGSTFQLVDGSGRVLVDSDPALQVDEVHLAQWFVDARS